MQGQQEITSQVVTPTYPWAFDVSNDPKELWNIGAANTWIGEPVGKILGRYRASVQQYPNAGTGAEGPPR